MKVHEFWKTDVYGKKLMYTKIANIPKTKQSRDIQKMYCSKMACNVVEPLFGSNYSKFVKTQKKIPVSVDKISYCYTS